MNGIEVITAYKIDNKLYEDFDSANRSRLFARLKALFENQNAQKILSDITEFKEVREEVLEILIDFQNNEIESNEDIRGELDT